MDVFHASVFVEIERKNLSLNVSYFVRKKPDEGKTYYAKNHNK
jgi:hypothetical protein